MNIHEILKNIAEQSLEAKPAGTKIADPIASGSEPSANSGKRSTDDGQKLSAKPGTDDKDPVASGDAPSSNSGKRGTDNTDQLAAKQGTDDKDPLAKITQGRGTEVQGNTLNASMPKKVMEDVEADLDAMVEDYWKGASKRSPEENKEVLKKSLKASVQKATEKHAPKKKEVEDMDESIKATSIEMKSAIEAALKEGTEFKVAVSEELAPLLKQDGITEEFATQATAIFESAVQGITAQHLAKVNAYVAEVVSQVFEAHTLDLQEQVEVILAKAVSEWAEENKLAIEVNTRTKIAESFMDGLKDLLEAHYVELPEEKQDMYEMAITKGEEILEKYEVACTEGQVVLDSLEEEKAKVRELEKKLFIESFSRDMIDTHAEKLRSLSENLEFISEEDLTAKLNVIKESIGKAPTKKIDSTLVVEDAQPLVDVTPVRSANSEMSALATSVGRMFK